MTINAGSQVTTPVADSTRLAVRDLTLGFLRRDLPPLVAVQNLSLSLAAGETFALVGESGSGKSLSALALMRLLPAGGQILSGDVMLAGENILCRPEATMREVRGGRLAMIFQEPGTSLNPVMTVGQQIGEVLLRHRGMAGATALAESQRLLDAVGIADAGRRLSEYPFQMSGGMKQRVMIAMALAGEPEVLIADEPTTALDVTVQAQILALLKEIQRERRMAMLLITHDLGIVAQVADRVGVMYAGEMVEEAHRGVFLRSPSHPYSRALMAALPDSRRRGVALRAIGGQVPSLTALASMAGCRFAPRCEWADSECNEQAPAWTELTPGRSQRARCLRLDETQPLDTAARTDRGIADVATRDAEARDTAALELCDLRVHFPIRRGLFKRTVGHVKAVDGVSLRVEAGKTLALVGESGCGKTTVGKAALRLIDAVGEVCLAGEPWAVEPDGVFGNLGRASRWRQQIQMVFQDPYASLNPRRSVGEILREGLDALGIGEASTRDVRIAQLLTEVGLDPSMQHRYPHEFSGGQRQRIAIARALAVNPSLLVCDEPTSALDVSVQAQILNLMRRLQDERKIAYLFITHNLAVVEFLADEVAVMYLGRIVERGPVGQVMRAPRHPYTQALLAAVPKIDSGRAKENLQVAETAMLGSASGGKAGRRVIEIASAANPPAGCHYHPRCPNAQPRCRETYPEETKLGDGHAVRCHFPVVTSRT